MTLPPMTLLIDDWTGVQRDVSLLSMCVIRAAQSVISLADVMLGKAG